MARTEDDDAPASVFPPGHYHSPIADPRELRRREDAIWRPRAGLCAVDLRVPQQLALLAHLRPFAAAIDYPVERAQGDDGTGYFYANGMFPALDAQFLFAALCHFRPRRVIEVGSGFSTLVMADANRRMLAGACDITCIEPWPRDFLVRGVPGVARVLAQRLEDVDPVTFDALDEGDLLFIDSSHVCKTGSDVHMLFFDLLPRLKPGVIVHIHDIFLPDEYPKAWVFDEGRNWNEQYVLHAFLMFNPEWHVLWAAHFMQTRHADAVEAVFPRFQSLGPGGSFWMRRAAPAPTGLAP
jgi:hypothetical protein